MCIRLLFGMVLPAAIAVASAFAQMSQQPGRPISGRSVVSTTQGIVAASHPLAAQAGTAILERGGNAVDAAIAANAVMGLMEPAMNGIGGDLFVIYYEAKTGNAYGLNSGGWAATGLTPEFLRERGQTRMPSLGIHSVTVPGVVAGWDVLRGRFGTKPFSELLAPAIHYSENGFPLTEIIAGDWAASVPLLALQSEAARTFLMDGRAPREGEIFRNPDLAKSLKLIAAGGRDGFYKGPTAEAILRLSAELGGTMMADDLAEYMPEWVSPVSTTYRGWKVSELPPNSTGIAALMMLNIMEQFPLADWGFHSARSLHVMIEAKKLAYADMIRYLGDPAFSRMPVDTLISKEHGAARARLIDMSKAACVVEPSHIEGYTNSAGNDTIYLSAIDRDGNIVSLIQSNYSAFGSGLVPAGTGFVLHNRGALFTLEPNHPNTLASRKRPLHTIIPALMQKDGIHIGFGIMGGFNQPQAHAQYVSNIADYGFNIQEALEAGRFTKPTFTGCDVIVERLVPDEVLSELLSLGHEVLLAPLRTGIFGWGQAVMSDPSGIHYGASEPRHDGAAIPQNPAMFGP